MISNRYVLQFSSTCRTDILQPPMAERNLLLVKDELCPTASFLNWVRLRCQLALIFKYKKDVSTFPQRDSTCWNLCNKMGSSDSGNMARFWEDKIVLSRNLHTKVNGFPPFPHVHGVFCAGKKIIATSAIDYFIVGPQKMEEEINISIATMVALCSFHTYESPTGSLSRLEAMTAVLCYPR